ncbi:Hpt domain-containing protein [Phenylobacterium sp. LjRoot219]|uniref:Hpt domain-containing protein n=1 Tax=Phenylobacterium sp. LjRoot219 TaxID=3342283 RepID=UPI003ECC44DF
MSDIAEHQAQLAFEQMLGPATALRLVRIFRDQLAERLTSDDPAAIRADAHKIAGSAAMLGFLSLGELARELETADVEGRSTKDLLALTLIAKREAQRVIGAWIRRLEASQPIA